MLLVLFEEMQWERAESREAPEALPERAWGIEEGSRWEGLWRVLVG